MRYVRFKQGGEICYGVLEGGTVTKISAPLFESYTLTRDTFALNELELECPTAPSKVVCVGLNYKDHIEEFGRSQIPESPVIFMKPSTACLPHKGCIVMPSGCERTDFEAELAIVIGKTCRNVSEQDANNYILGYSCVNDVTARDFQRADGQWTRAKGFDTFCPYGPYITPLDDPNNLNIKSYLNGQLMQNSNTASMIFNPFRLVSFISGIMTLLPGDIIATGTPMGVAPLADGDCVEIDIEGVGRLANNARRAAL